MDNREPVFHHMKRFKVPLFDTIRGAHQWYFGHDINLRSMTKELSRFHDVKEAPRFVLAYVQHMEEVHEREKSKSILRPWSAGVRHVLSAHVRGTATPREVEHTPVLGRLPD